MSRLMVTYILRRGLESNYAKVGPYRSKGMYKEHREQNSILYIQYPQESVQP